MARQHQAWTLPARLAAQWCASCSLAFSLSESDREVARSQARATMAGPSTLTVAALLRGRPPAGPTSAARTAGRLSAGGCRRVAGGRATSSSASGSASRGGVRLSRVLLALAHFRSSRTTLETRLTRLRRDPQSRRASGATTGSAAGPARGRFPRTGTGTPSLAAVAANTGPRGWCARLVHSADHREADRCVQVLVAQPLRVLALVSLALRLLSPFASPSSDSVTHPLCRVLCVARRWAGTTELPRPCFRLPLVAE